MAREFDCIRPGCEGRVTFDKGYGDVDMVLERSADVIATYPKGKICSGCSNDLADWWLHGKKSQDA